MKIFKVNLIIFLLFSQVSANVHWHVDEYDNDLEIRLSIHPSELVNVNYSNTHHNDPIDHHDHNDLHFESNDNFTRRPNSNISQIFKSNLTEKFSTPIKLKVFTYNYIDVVLFRAPCSLQSKISDRAPPQYT